MTLRPVPCRPHLAGLAALALAAAHAGPASAQTAVFDFGVVGIVSGQRARLNVADVGSATTRGSCSLRLSFLNRAGQEVAGTDVEVQPGHTASFEYVPSPDQRISIAAVARENLLVRGRATILDEACADAELTPTLEVLDADGKTTLTAAPASGTPKVTTKPVLATSAVFRAGTALLCFVANISQTKTVEVDIQVIDENGNSEISVSETIAPRVIGGAVSDPTGRVLGYCRIVLRSGNKDDVRASYCVEGDSALDCLVTGDAR